MISFNYYQYKGCVRKDLPYFYPLNIFIYTMNWILDLPCIALLWLWMWNYPIDDPENVIQGDFILSPFPIRQNIGLNRGGGHWQLPWIRVAVWRFPKWERTYWEVFSMHFRNYPLNDIDTITSRKSRLVRLSPYTESENWKMIDIENAYKKFENLMEQVDRSCNISLDEEESLYRQIEDDIKWKLQQVHADRNTW